MLRRAPASLKRAARRGRPAARLLDRVDVGEGQAGAGLVEDTAAVVGRARRSRSGRRRWWSRRRECQESACGGAVEGPALPRPEPSMSRFFETISWLLSVNGRTALEVMGEDNRVAVVAAARVFRRIPTRCRRCSGRSGCWGPSSLQVARSTTERREVVAVAAAAGADARDRGGRPRAGSGVKRSTAWFISSKES